MGMNNVLQFFMDIALNLQIALGSMNILITLIIHIHKHGRSLTFYVIIRFYHCLTRFFTTLIAFIPKGFFFFAADVFSAILNGTHHTGSFIVGT